MQKNAKDKLQFERQLQEEGIQYIAALDEVGRGPLAGPVVCAAVIMPLEEAMKKSGVSALEVAGVCERFAKIARATLDELPDGNKEEEHDD